MKEPNRRSRDLSPESVSAMEKVSSGASELALRASIDLCITLLRKNGFSLEEIEKYINHRTAIAIRNFNTQ